ncbi:hypothetical protein GCM10023157_17810 [Gluconacetobacter asukensis]
MGGACRQCFEEADRVPGIEHGAVGGVHAMGRSHWVLLRGWQKKVDAEQERPGTGRVRRVFLSIAAERP